MSMVQNNSGNKKSESDDTFFYESIWHRKWPDEILNSQELSSRRKRSHSLKLISINRDIPEAMFLSASKTEKLKGRTYTTTLTKCTCTDFIRGHGKYPCKHIFRLAEELGLFRNEKFEQGEYDYTFDDLPPEIKVLPEVLRTESRELVEKYLMILRFIIKGRKACIKELEKTEGSELIGKKLGKLRAYYELRGEAREIKQYKYKDEHDELLQQLIDMGLVEAIEKDMTITVRLADSITLNDVEKTIEVYGENLPLFLQNVTKDPLRTLSEIITSKRRSEQILRPYDARETPDWAFRVPECFNDALDIKLVTRIKNSVNYTAWTQGINFAFEAGDIFYRNQAAYEKGFPALQIISAKKARGMKKENLNIDTHSTTSYLEEGTILNANGYYPGEVTYKDFETGNVKTKTQTDFVKMLIGEMVQ